MWLQWQAAVLLAIVLTGFGFAGRPHHRRAVAMASAFAREAALVLVLYSIWQIAGRLSVMHVDGAFARGRWIFDVERAARLPSEAGVQRLILPHPWLVQAANSYYAIAHVPALVAFLVWLFACHRDRYAPVRNVLAVATGASLLLQLVPVAPPRLLTGLGFVDTAARYHQSVYPRIGEAGPDQLSAMPSVHVLWAVLIAIVAMQVGRSGWRWLGPAHGVLTVVVVVATANHWWLDGVVAVALLALAAAGQRSARTLRDAARIGPTLPPERGRVPVALRRPRRPGLDTGSPFL